MLLDLLAVTLAAPGPRSCRRSRARLPGPAASTRTIGSDRVDHARDAAALLDAVAACCLELDEGNKYAAGHPAAHVVFAAIAAARRGGQAGGRATFLAAVVAGYEVAARFGRAVRNGIPRWHPHGHWGATGAADRGGSRPRRARQGQVAAAIDAVDLPHPRDAVAGGPRGRVRPQPVDGRGQPRRARGGSAGAGRAGHQRRAAQHSLGEHRRVRSTRRRLTDGLGSDWLVLEGYAKQHSACSYTHAVVDAVQAIRRGADWTADDVTEMVVRTHRLAEPLLETEPDNRLGAMFSLPFVTAMALVSDAVDPDAMDPGGALLRARSRASRPGDACELSSDLDDLLPRRRAAEVVVHLRDGTHIGLGVPNPVGRRRPLPVR